MDLILSLPPALRDDLLCRVAIVETRSAFEGLFQSAKRSLKILAPYVDPTFTGLVQGVTAEIRMITTASAGHPVRPNPVLERCATTRNLKVRYLSGQKDRDMMYQAHAKLLIADGARAYLGSANLTDTSIHYNLELGVILEDRAALATLERIFDHLFEQVALPASLL